MRFFRAGISLRTAIPVLLGCVILFSTAVVSWVSFTGSREAVGDMALQLRKEVSHRITEHLLDFLRLPHEINRSNALALQNGLVPADDPELLIARFADQVQLFPSVSSIYFGNEQGGLANSGREPEHGLRYSIRTDDFKAGVFRKFALDSQGNQGGEMARVASFDSRTRPWYTKALLMQGPVWSDVYVLFTGQDMALAASRPVFDQRGRTLGVVSVDVFLSQITAFLQRLRIGSAGKAFIVERSGLLVAGSGTEPLFIPGRDGNPSRRLMGTDSRDPLVQGAMQTLISKFGALDRINAEHHLDFSDRGRKILMTVSALRDPLGIDWLIVVDEARVRQILFNLVGNALKYTDQGGVTVELSPVHPDPCMSGGVCVRVVDTGVGIPEHMLSGVFEPFRQVEDSHTRKYEGAGLGLTIVRRLVELMHGTIDVESAAGSGTSVRVTLPLRAASEYCSLTKTVPEVPDDDAGRALRILLAEDEAINQLAMRTLLERAGHVVAIARNGQEVLDLLRAEDFDCILMDVQMPVMSGVEATRTIRAWSGPKGDIPIIALTAHAMSGDRESFLQAGMDDYLPKPVGMADLVAAITRLVRVSNTENG